ncbi:MAG: hypothetical protein EOP50_08345 [Sphingobacteriales bacterium]|nr:MAG: hypothetical protein EOP50_08345 [Sphingobacteriales bacterium]
MKAYFGAALLCVGLLPNPARACDICGCGVSNYNPYLFPHLSKSFVGLTYLHRRYHTHAEDGSSGTERYNALLLTGQYKIGKRLQLMTALPYMRNSLESPTGNRKASGPGDATLLGRVLLWDHLTKRARQSVLPPQLPQMDAGRRRLV